MERGRPLRRGCRPRHGGIQSWQAASYPTESYAQVSADALAAAMHDGKARQVLDVRPPSEWQAGSLPGAQWCYVPDLLDGAHPAIEQSESVWVVCAGEFRASIAASLLQRPGSRPVVLADGGVASSTSELSPINGVNTGRQNARQPNLP